MLTNKTACQIEIQGLTTRVDIQSTLQASEVDHDQEAAEYIAKVGRVVSTLSEGICTADIRASQPQPLYRLRTSRKIRHFLGRLWPGN